MHLLISSVFVLGRFFRIAAFQKGNFEISSKCKFTLAPPHSELPDTLMNLRELNVRVAQEGFVRPVHQAKFSLNNKVI